MPHHWLVRLPIGSPRPGGPGSDHPSHAASEGDAYSPSPLSRMRRRRPWSARSGRRRHSSAKKPILVYVVEEVAHVELNDPAVAAQALSEPPHRAVGPAILEAREALRRERAIPPRRDHLVDRVVHDPVAHRGRRHDATLGVHDADLSVATWPVPTGRQLVGQSLHVHCVVERKSGHCGPPALAPGERTPRLPHIVGRHDAVPAAQGSHREPTPTVADATSGGGQGRVRPRSARCATSRGNPHHTKPKVVVPVRGLVPVPVRAAQVLRWVVPRAAPHHPMRRGSSSTRPVTNRSASVMVPRGGGCGASRRAADQSRRARRPRRGAAVR